MKRILSLLLVLIMVLSMVVSCGDTEKKSSSKKDKGSVSTQEVQSTQDSQGAGDTQDSQGTGDTQDSQGTGDTQGSQGTGGTQDSQGTGDTQGSQGAGDTQDSQGTGGNGQDVVPTQKRLKAVFLADVSASALPLKGAIAAEMEKIYQELKGEYDAVELSIIPFAKDVFEELSGEGAIGAFVTRTYDSENTQGTNIEKAIISARGKLNGSFEYSQSDDKIIFLFSDGLELEGDSALVINNLASDGITFENTVVSLENEVQLSAVSSTGYLEAEGKLKVEVVIDTKRATSATLKVFDSKDTLVATESVSLNEGRNVCSITPVFPDVEGITVFYVTVESEADSIDGNNRFYSWFKKERAPAVLVVEGSYGQFEQIQNSAVMDNLRDFSISVISTEEFPDTLEALLDYDQVVLMDVNFDNLPTTASDNLKRYVEEVGRGLFVSFGDNFYDIKGEAVGGIDAEYKQIPLEAILPVNLKLEGEKETVAMVMVLDLSSSMKEIMPGGEKSRFEALVESVKNAIMLGATEEEQANNLGFDSEDYVGVICFDQSYHIALDIVQVGDLENRQKICENVEYELRHYYYYYYQYPNGVESDIPVHKDDKEIPAALDPLTGDTVQLVKPNITNIGNYDKDTGYFIKSYGTEYKWAVQAAADMLAKRSSETLLHVKQVLMISDGEPNTKNNGYVSIVERMSNAGIVTSTISIGADSSTKELDKIAVAGGGTRIVVNDAESLANEIIKKAEEINSELINERPVLPIRNTYDSTVLTGVRDFEVIGGYYPSAIKEGADLVLYVDQKKPLYAEWTYGLGKVCVYMSDLGNSDWTGSLFKEEDENGIRLVTNMMNAAVDNRVGSTGLEWTVDRTGGALEICVVTPVDIRSGEGLVLQIFDQNGSVQDTIKLAKVAMKRYMCKLETVNPEESYTVKLLLVTEKNNTINDSITFAVTGCYNEEYNVFPNSGADVPPEDEDELPGEGESEALLKIAYISKYVVRDEDKESMTADKSLLYFAIKAAGYTIDSYDMFDNADDAADISGYDLYIYEGITPYVLPTDGAVWLLDAKSAFGSETGIVIEQAVNENKNGYRMIPSVRVDAVGEILQNVNFDTPLTFEGEQRYAAVSIYRPIVEMGQSFKSVFEVEGQSIMIVGNYNGTRMIVSTFDVINSSLIAFVTDFPMLIRNMIEYSK